MTKIKIKKEDIIKELSNQTGYSNNFSKKLINDLLEIIIQNIQISDVKIKNIGTFKKIYKKERIGRNPKTREEHIITARNSIIFIPSKRIINYLNTLT